ncbi:MAG: phosphocarrier protein [bacterium]|nr:MAG: phosphocarrier protein [bacterium]
MQQRYVTIINRLGLHARASARLVNLANQYRAEVKVARADTKQAVDGKSILGVLLLAASKGTELIISAEGEDEEPVVRAICDLINNKFGEEGDVF